MIISVFFQQERVHNNYVKLSVVKAGIAIASKEWSISKVDFLLDSNCILDRESIAAVYDPVKELILLNESWLNHATTSEILLVLFHEMRHHYQRQMINLYLNGHINNIYIKKIKQWKSEFDSYLIPDQTSMDNYLNQSIEKDAVEFSNKLLNSVVGLI